MTRKNRRVKSFKTLRLIKLFRNSQAKLGRFARVRRMILDQQILISGMYETFKDRGDPDPQACKGKIRHRVPCL